MGLLYRAFLCFCFVITSAPNVKTYDDAVVIEAATSRKVSRQVNVVPPFHPFLYQAVDYSSALVASGPCFTSKGILGKCIPFRQCYPYFKLPDVNNWDTWVIGMYDTCSYFTAQGRQMFGVCCTTPTTTTEMVTEEGPKPEEVQENAKVPQYQISNWPPPLPTHPPDHTIPPLPTHPPSPGLPSSTVKNTKKPTLPWFSTTNKPKPTYVPTTTTRKPQSGPPINTGSCGVKNGNPDQERIVGGHNADKGEWPWIAALFNGGRQFCGGSLIDDIHILSAAHCVAHMSSWDVARLTVRLADYNIKTNTDVRHIEKKVKRVVRHKGFDSRTLYNDIAILTLDSPMQFTSQIRPICLPSTTETYAGKIATVIGWGSIRESGPQPAVLQEVSIPVWSNYECKSKYGNAAPGGIVDHMLCAGQASRDSCSGDSGGPLMVNTGNRWIQVGIVSWGIGCGKGQYPGVYTRVEKFLPWIYKNLK